MKRRSLLQLITALIAFDLPGRQKRSAPPPTPSPEIDSAKVAYWEDAVAYWEEMVSRRPDFPYARANLADCEHKLASALGLDAKHLENARSKLAKENLAFWEDAASQNPREFNRQWLDIARGEL